jgi:hypothetical protein
MPIDAAQMAGLILIAVFGVFIAVFAGGALAGRRPTLRRLSGYQMLPGQLSRAIEAGQSLHFSLGTGGVGGSDTATTLAGLSALAFLAEEAAATETLPTVTVADATAMVMAQDVLRRAYIRQGNPTAYDPRSVRYVAASPLPYAAGTMDVLSNEDTSVSVMVGVFGPEVALIAEEGSKQGLAQIAGAADVAPLAVLYPTVNHLLVGEEMFAAGGYTTDQSAHLGSLRAQDLIRWILVVVIFVVSLGALAQQLGILTGGGAP